MTRAGRDDVGEDQKDMRKECGRRERDLEEGEIGWEQDAEREKMKMN